MDESKLKKALTADSRDENGDEEDVKPIIKKDANDEEENDSDEEDDGNFEDGGSEEEEDEEEGDEEASDSGNVDSKSALKKRKISSPEGSESKPKVSRKEKDGKKKNRFVDDEAAESGDDDDDDDDAGDEEQANTYVYDDFMVRDDTEGVEAGAGAQSKKKKREFSRLKKRTADVTLEEEDLQLIEDNLRAEYDGKGTSFKPAPISISVL
jgi:Acidic N-terminal SPT6